MKTLAINVLALLPVLAAEEGGEETISLWPAPAELIWGLIFFALLLAFLWRFALPQLGTALDQRAARIQGRLEEAEQVRSEAEELRSQYQQRLSEAREESRSIVDEARQTAERRREELVAEAEEEAEQIRSQAREEAEAERGRVVQELRGQLAVLSVELASKIVQKELDEEQHRDLVDQYINELSGLN